MADAAVRFAALGIPPNKAAAERAGVSWEVCKRALDRQWAVAECRRRSAVKMLADKTRYR